MSTEKNNMKLPVIFSLLGHNTQHPQIGGEIYFGSVTVPGWPVSRQKTHNVRAWAEKSCSCHASQEA